jgi:hypothetical protein
MWIWKKCSWDILIFLEPLSQTWLLSKGFAFCPLGVWLKEHRHFNTWLLQVRVKSLDEIDRICEESQGWLPCMMILYDGRKQILIVKLMVGVIHECVACEFACMFDLKLLDLHVCRSILAIGSARFGCPSNKSKEIDVNYKPHSCGLEDDWPSFVIEVGVSRSYAMLRADVAHWLTNNNGKTWIVILLSINRIDWQILVEWWEEVPWAQPSSSTINYSCIPRMVQSLTLDANVQYDGPSLEISSNFFFFDILLENIPRREFLFILDNFNALNEIIWSTFQ